MYSLSGFFFFFQAEDGIRDLYVTGVQTCALPISPHHREIAAPCRLLVAGSGRSIHPIARAAPRHSGANGRPPSREDRATRGRREIFPGPPVSDKKEAVVPAQRCPQWQCYVA